MEAFVGQWEGCTADGPELDAFLAANGLTSHKASYIQKVLYSIAIDGDKISTTFKRHGEEAVTINVEVGKRCETTFPHIGKGFVTITKEGEYLLSKQEMADNVFINKCRVVGNQLTLEISGKGKSITTVLNKA